MSLSIPIGKSLRKIFGIREDMVWTSVKEEKRFYNSERIFLDAYNKACNEIIHRITKQLGLPREEIILRRLISQDLGLKEFYKFNFKKGLNKNIIKTIPKKRFITINGFTIPKNCSISQIIIWREGVKIRHWHIEGFEGTYFLDDPFLIDMNQSLKIDMYSESNKKQKLIFHGSVTEERGKTIIP